MLADSANLECHKLDFRGKKRVTNRNGTLDI